MKSKIILQLIMFLVTATYVNAQDIITKKDDSTIEVKVVEITTDMVKYKKYNNLEGPLYNIPIVDIKAITYQNGTVEKFNESLPTSYDNQTALTAESDENLVQEYQNLNQYSVQNPSISDQRLLALGYGNLDWRQYEKKARTYRLVGGIGGGALIIAGAVLMGVYFGNDYDDGFTTIAIIPGALLTGIGVIGGTTMFVMAHNQSQKAREIKSLTLSESTVFQGESTRLTASIDMLRDRKNPAIGIGLKLCF